MTSTIRRTYQVRVQSDEQFKTDSARHRPAQSPQRIRRDGADRDGAQLRSKTIPDRVPALSLFPAAEVQGERRRASHRHGVAAHGRAGERGVRKGITFERTDLAFAATAGAARRRSSLVGAAAPLSSWSVAQYEAGSCAAIVLILPMCLLAPSPACSRGHADRHPGGDRLRRSARARGEERDPIRRVARQKEEERRRWATPPSMPPHAPAPDPDDLARVQSRRRPLAVATGGGAEMRQSLGTAVLFGMLGVTCFGLLFTPAFYTAIRRLGHEDRSDRVSEVGGHPVSPSPARRRTEASA